MKIKLLLTLFIAIIFFSCENYPQYKYKMNYIQSVSNYYIINYNLVNEKKLTLDNYKSRIAKKDVVFYYMDKYGGEIIFLYDTSYDRILFIW